MSLFSKIADRILGRSAAPAAAPAAPAKPAPIFIDGSAQTADIAPPAPPALSPAAEPVDVAAVLTDLATQRAGKSDWTHSIVDLLKLLDLDSSLEARKELATELGVNAGAHGSAEQNIALHKAVMKKLAENGGNVPDELKD
ncbi:MAG: DUF3597 family protein [Pseudoxanthomonas sp.]